MEEKIYQLNGTQLIEMLKKGYEYLKKDYLEINDLNVFPVPDGDTGTNMKITYENGLASIRESLDASEVMADFAKGTLFGARGNSGVLLSQYFQGIAVSLHGLKEIKVSDFVSAMDNGTVFAYKCAVNPTEGTILTVGRESVANIKSRVFDKDDFGHLFTMIVEEMSASLNNTPNLLKVLKDNNVIDSGGKGLLSIFEGYLSYFTGDELPVSQDHGEFLETSKIDFANFDVDNVMQFGYCTEFLLRISRVKNGSLNVDLDAFRKSLEQFGDSLIVTQNGTIIKVHIHTLNPGLVIGFAQKYGEFLTFKMDNMDLQFNSLKKKSVRKDKAIIAIAQGEGIIELFKELGCDIVLDGGETMNTSTEDIINAFKAANADDIVLLVNNPNIFLAAKQAIELYSQSNVYLVDSKSIQQGYFALSTMMQDGTAEEIYEVMQEQIQNIDVAFVAKTSKDSLTNGVTSHKGDYIGVLNGKIMNANLDRLDATCELFKNIPDIEDKEIAYIFVGEDVSEDEAEELKANLEDLYPYLDIGLIYGKQRIYDYLIGVVL